MAEERKVVVTLTEQEVQWVEQSVLHEDAQAALEFSRDLLKPRVDETANRPHCKPIFEWDKGEELRPSDPPDAS